MKKNNDKKLVILIALLIIVVDHVIKLIVKQNMTYGESIGNWIKLTYVTNPGMAYNIGENTPMLAIILNIALISVLVVFLIKYYAKMNTALKIFLTFIISGGISNLVDRIIIGYIVDYIDITKLFSYPIFNIADIFVTLGVVLTIVYILVKSIKNRRNLKSEKI